MFKTLDIDRQIYFIVLIFKVKYLFFVYVNFIFVRALSHNGSICNETDGLLRSFSRYFINFIFTCLSLNFLNPQFL